MQSQQSVAELVLSQQASKKFSAKNTPKQKKEPSLPQTSQITLKGASAKKSAAKQQSSAKKQALSNVVEVDEIVDLLDDDE